MRQGLERACAAALTAAMLAGCGGGSPCLGCFGSEAPAPPPSIASLTPDSVVAGGPAFTLTVTGANFSSASVVEMRGASSSQSVPTTFIDEATLHAAVPAAAIASAQSIQLIVSNSPSLVSAPAAFAVVAQPDFALAASTATLTVRPGNSATASLDVRPLAGFNGTVTFSLGALPAGVTGSFDPASVTASGVTTLTLSADAAVAPTATPLAVAVLGSAGAIVHAAGVQLEVVATSGVGVLDVISRGNLGVFGNGLSLETAVSANGRYAAFSSDATNLVVPSTRREENVFLHEGCVGAIGCSPFTQLASAIDGLGVEGGNATLGAVAIDGSGRFVGFASSAVDLTATVANAGQSYLRDTCIGTAAGCIPSTTMVSLTSSGAEPNRGSDGIAISSDGRLVAFRSDGTDLVANVTTPGQIYLRDTCRTGSGMLANCRPTTLLVSADDAGNPADSRSAVALSMSSTGRFVAFSSQASNFPGAASGRFAHDYVRDTCFNVPGCTPSTLIASVDDAGNPFADGDLSQRPALSGDGRYVAFSVLEPLVPGAFARISSIYLRDTCRSEAGPLPNCRPSTRRASAAAGGLAANDDSAIGTHALSATGRYLLFVSLATNIVAGVAQPFGVYVQDTCAGVTGACTPGGTRLVSVDRSGAFVPAVLAGSAISADGHYATFVVHDNSGPLSNEAVLALTGF